MKHLIRCDQCKLILSVFVPGDQDKQKLIHVSGATQNLKLYHKVLRHDTRLATSRDSSTHHLSSSDLCGEVAQQESELAIQIQLHGRSVTRYLLRHALLVFAPASCETIETHFQCGVDFGNIKPVYACAEDRD